MKFSFSLCLLATTSLIALSSGDVLAKAAKSNHSFSGGIQIGISTDRNAGAAGGAIRSASSASKDDGDEDEDEDDDDDAASIGDDVLDDLDLEDDDSFDDLEDDEAIADGEADLDGDGIIDGTEGDTTEGAADIGADAAAMQIRRSPKAAKAPPKTVRDERLSTKAAIGHKYAMSSSSAWKTGLSYTGANQRDLKKNDNYILALGTGPEFKLLKGDLTLNPSVAYARLSKDSKHVFDTYAASFGAKYKLNKMFAVKSKYTYSMQNFQSSKLDDVYGNKFALGLAMKPFKNGTAEVGYSFKTVDATPASKEKDQNEIGAKYQHDFPMKFYAIGEARYKWTDYDVAASKKVPVREDEEYNLGFSIGKEIYKGMTLELQYDNRTASTNIPNKDTSNDRFALVSSWKF